ncbi:hypothetical protein [uncultured Hyphomicrobium sp.]|uniref:hypothetical protein n=1 Tax=uncultured Hyphomicrobium sp. TaxID=194373 RepID=UPI0025EA6691|nr:hypothetical protein [uncultured Hyphomicrobium sp.]
MTFDPAPNDPLDAEQRKRRSWGAVGLFIVGLVVALAVIVTLVGPTSTQQASNEPPSATQFDPPQPAQ